LLRIGDVGQVELNLEPRSVSVLKGEGLEAGPYSDRSGARFSMTSFAVLSLDDSDAGEGSLGPSLDPVVA
jgi:hypothetical protein